MNIEDRVYDKVDYEVWKLILAQVQEQVGTKIFSKIRIQVWGQTVKIEYRITDNLLDEVKGRLDEH
jgi:hypothetical protein